MKAYLKNTLLLLVFMFAVLLLEGAEARLKKSANKDFFAAHPELVQQYRSLFAGDKKALESRKVVELSQQLYEREWRISWGIAGAQFLLTLVFGGFAALLNRRPN